jgi:hypothetical protein
LLLGRERINIQQVNVKFVLLPESAVEQHALAKCVVLIHAMFNCETSDSEELSGSVYAVSTYWILQNEVPVIQLFYCLFLLSSK